LEAAGHGARRQFFGGGGSRSRSVLQREFRVLVSAFVQSKFGDMLEAASTPRLVLAAEQTDLGFLLQ